MLVSVVFPLNMHIIFLQEENVVFCFAGPKVIIETVSLTVGMLLINTLIILPLWNVTVLSLSSPPHAYL